MEKIGAERGGGSQRKRRSKHDVVLNWERLRQKRNCGGMREGACQLKIERRHDGEREVRKKLTGGKVNWARAKRKGKKGTSVQVSGGVLDVTRKRGEK